MAIDAPTNCPVCGAAMSHDAPRVGDLRARIFNCGATVCDLAKGEWEVTLYCDKTGDLLRHLRADNVRLGDRNVLLATELQAIADAAEKQLGGWATAPLDAFGYLWDLRALRDILDLATEALEGQPAAAAAPSEPDHGQLGLEQTTAARVGERS